MTVLSLVLPLINEIKVCIYNDALAAHSIRQLKNYIIDIHQEFNVDKSYKISIISQNNMIINKALQFLSKNRTLARKIIINNNRIYVDNSIYIISNNDFTILSNKKYTWYRKYYHKIKSGLYSFYHSLFYELFLFPIFSIYCMIDGYYLIHGSLLSLNGRNILIMGLDGVGKSSLSIELDSHGADILADNFVLYNGITVIPFNMALRLSPKQKSSFDILYQDNDLKEVLPTAIINKPVKPDKYFILSIANEIRYTQKKLNHSILPLFLNNAPEIGQANNFITPFLYMIMNEKEILTKDTDVIFLEIPLGQLKKGVDIIIND